MRGLPRSSACLVVLAASVAAAQPRLGAAPDMNAVQSFAGSSWASTIAPLPSPRHHAVSAVVDGKLFVIGGSHGPGGRALDDVYSLDPATGRWTRRASMPVPRGNAGAAIVAGNIFVAGGGVPPGVVTPTVLLYDPKGETWSAAPSMVEERAGEDVFAANNGVLAFSGMHESRLSTPTIERLSRGRWSIVGKTPLARFEGASVEIAGRFYFFGGNDGVNGSMLQLADAESYDPTTDRWAQLAPMPTQRQGVGAAVVDGKVYLAGGYQTGRPYLAAFESYDPASDSWTRLPPLPRPRGWAAVASLSGKVVVVGGTTNGTDGTTTVQVYDPKSRIWEVYEDRSAVAFDATPAIRFARKAPERPDDYALVVGVDGYKTLPRAEFAENDAREMATAFASLGVPDENVVTLTGAKATLPEVSKYVEEWLPKRATKDSRVYFYFSGHGAPDVKDGSAYLMPWDADAAFVKSTGFSLKRLYAALGSLPARQVVAVFDSCFSGAGGRSVVAPGLRPLVTVRLPTGAPPRVSVLAAAEKDEVAGSYPERGHGLFTYHVLQGLAGAADEKGAGHVTIEELYAYARKRVILDARRRQNREQTPTLTTADPKLELY